MRHLALIFVILVMATTVTCMSAEGECIYVKDVTMHLDGDDATFELNYSLDTFTRFYVLALGCRHLEPELLSFLSGYPDVRLIKADTEGAALQVKGAGEYNGSCYLFDSHPFGPRNNPGKTGIAKFSVVYPEGRIRTFYNVTSTQISSYPASRAIQILPGMKAKK